MRMAHQHTGDGDIAVRSALHVDGKGGGVCGAVSAVGCVHRVHGTRTVLYGRVIGTTSYDVQYGRCSYLYHDVASDWSGNDQRKTKVR